MGRPSYPNARRLLITADAGGSNGSRLRLCKLELQKLADETGNRCVSLPAGHQQVEQDRASTLLVHQPKLARQASAQFRNHRQSDRRDQHLNWPQGSSELNTEAYVAGIKVYDQAFAQIKIRRDRFHGDWNYEIHASILPDPGYF
jgi:hypothetical protein